MLLLPVVSERVQQLTSGESDCTGVCVGVCVHLSVHVIHLVVQHSTAHMGESTSSTRDESGVGGRRVNVSPQQPQCQYSVRLTLYGFSYIILKLCSNKICFINVGFQVGVRLLQRLKSPMYHQKRIWTDSKPDSDGG